MNVSTNTSLLSLSGDFQRYSGQLDAVLHNFLLSFVEREEMETSQSKCELEIACMGSGSFHACSGRVTTHGLGKFGTSTEGKGHFSLVINTSGGGRGIYPSTRASLSRGLQPATAG